MNMTTSVVALLLLGSGLMHPFDAGAATQYDPPADRDMWFYLSSHGTDQVFRIRQDSGELLGTLEDPVPGPFASFVAPNRDFFVSAETIGAVYRYDGLTGKLKDVFVQTGSGGLSRPTAPILTPDGKYLIVGDLVLNGYLRFDGHTGEYLGIFAEPGTKPINGPFMPVFSPYPELKGKILIASGFTNSIQIYEIETGNYEGDFVKPGSGGLITPIGLVFGPDGNLYTSSGGTNSVKRYNGRTGEFIDTFVPTGSGGLNTPRALEFGGSNGDLHVVSNATNNVLKFDRRTGEFKGVAASGEALGFSDPRGLMFTLRPFSFASATPAEITARGRDNHRFVPVNVQFYTVKGTIDSTTNVELLSVEVNDVYREVNRDVKSAHIGTDDRRLLIRAYNESDSDRVFTLTYRISNPDQAPVLTTTTVTVHPTPHWNEES